MNDQFSERAGAIDAPAGGGAPIIPDDGVMLGTMTRALYVGSGGTVVVEMARGQTLSFANVPDGALLPVRVVKVLTATTASDIIGLY